MHDKQGLVQELQAKINVCKNSQITIVVASFAGSHNLTENHSETNHKTVTVTFLSSAFVIVKKSTKIMYRTSHPLVV